MAVIQQEAIKKRTNDQVFLVDVSQSLKFARSGSNESPTWARSTRLCAVRPGLPLSTAQMVSPEAGLASRQDHRVWILEHCNFELLLTRLA